MTLAETEDFIKVLEDLAKKLASMKGESTKLTIKTYTDLRRNTIEIKITLE